MESEEVELEESAARPVGTGGRLLAVSVLIGVVALAGALAWGFCLGDGFRRFFHAYLLSFFFYLSLSLGALFFVLLHHLTRAGWSVVVRRVAEFLAANLLLLAFLALPIVFPVVFGNAALYPWAGAENIRGDELLERKAIYLNPGFFALRCAFYFAVFGLLARHYLKRSVAQDRSGDVEISRRLDGLSGFAMAGYALTLTFAAFDLLMSLDPHWFSTIFGVYVFAGSAAGGYALLIVALLLLQRRGRLGRTVTVEHYHDLGKLLFAFVFFWGYIAFSQFLLIWYANLPEETGWYRIRMSGAWAGVSLALLFGHFVLPFVGLLSRSAKRSRLILGFWAVWMLAAHWLDCYWLVFPQYTSRGVFVPQLTPDAGPAIPWPGLELLCLVGLGGLYVASAVSLARGCALVPVRDPRLAESLAFENR